MVKNLIRPNNWKQKSKEFSKPFIADEFNVLKRNYDNYEEYLKHQSSKLHLRIDEIKEYDHFYQKVVKERYMNLQCFEKKSIICLAARLGGEVRAFKELGALAIGIDIEPGEKNQDVIHGDFHNINFPDGVFDFAFCNAIDHVLDLDAFFSEANRILKPDGSLIAELGNEKPSKFEVIDTQNHFPILAIAEKYFKVEREFEVKNEIGFVNWTGIVYKMKK